MYRTSLLVTLLVTLAPPVLANGIGMATAWKDTLLDQKQCIDRAKLALWRSGFWQNMTVEPRSVSAESPSYTAKIRCFPETKTVIFAVAGEDSVMAEQLQHRISQNFE
jgi:hypothetical protein